MIHYTKRVCTVSAFDIDGNQNIMLTIFRKKLSFCNFSLTYHAYNIIVAHHLS